MDSPLVRIGVYVITGCFIYFMCLHTELRYEYSEREIITYPTMGAVEREGDEVRAAVMYGRFYEKHFHGAVELSEGSLPEGETLFNYGQVDLNGKFWYERGNIKIRGRFLFNEGERPESSDLL